LKDDPKMVRKVRNIVIFVALVLVACGAFGLWAVPLAKDSGDTEALRTRLLAHLIQNQLAENHYSGKAVDDVLSRAAFELYLEQLDYQKRFLLREDVESLRHYADRIDDEMISGDIQLVRAGSRLLRLRIAAVQDMVPQLMAKEEDFQKQEFFETDPAKRDYCGTLQELRERWRRMLKYQVLLHYAELLLDKQAKADPAALAAKPLNEDLLRQAREKTLSSTRHLLTRLLNESEREHLERYLNAFARAFDPHTNYLAPDEMEDFEISMKGSLEGIGATLREDEGFIRVVEILPGSPAARQGQLHPEDIILKVAEGKREPVDITDTRVRQAVRLIRGRKGTEIRLTVRKPTGVTLVIPLIRDVVEIEEGFVKSAVLPLPGDGSAQIGYLRIPSFYRDFEGNRNGRVARNVTDDVERELKQLQDQGVVGLVLDLRNNGGGALTDAISIAGLFLPQGPMVQVRDGQGDMTVFNDQDVRIVYHDPVVVLVNRFSASASEILAAAIQDYGRGLVVGGDGTHGKGTVQGVFSLDQALEYGPLRGLGPLGALKVTMQKFYRITGASTQVKGVVPDIVLPDSLEFLKSGEQFSKNPLPWDTVAAVSFEPWSEPRPDLEALRRQSRARVSRDADFAAIKTENRRNVERSKNSLRSLRLAAMVQEMAELRNVDEGAEMPGWFGGRGTKNGDPSSILKKDPYAREAAAVLSDLLQFMAGDSRQVVGF